MTPSTRGTKLLSTGALAALVVGAWLTFAPPQLGGSTSYVITHGNSMEPRIQEGDLVLLREGSYGPGTVVGYRSDALQQVVMHRIVEETPQGFVTKGDNNTWLDTDRPTDADVIGREWLHIPGAGKWMGRLRSPVVATALIGAAAVAFFVGDKDKRRRARKGERPQLPFISFTKLSVDQRKLLGGIGAATAVLVLLAGIAFTQPRVGPVTADAAFEHVGEFDFEAKVETNAVYPTGRVEPGRPVFLKLVDQLNVSFDYTLNSKAATAVEGEAMMFARVAGATGWRKAVPVTPAKTFRGTGVRLDGVLDLRTIKELSTEVQAVTGLSESNQTIELIPRVDVRGEIEGASFEEQFAPQLDFEMDAYQLRLAAGDEASLEPGSSTAALRQTVPGEVSVSEVRSHALGFLGLSVGIDTLRRVSSLGLLFALIAGAVLWTRFSKTRQDLDEVGLIAVRYGHWLIPVERLPVKAQRGAVRVASMEALIRLAELYERMVLHGEAKGVHTYFLEEDGVVYCYRTSDTSASASATPTPDGAPAAPSRGGAKLREERRKDEAARLRKELLAIETNVLRTTRGSDPREATPS
jgi:signal peptidase I